MSDRLTTSLGALRREAPGGLLPAVLAATGLADRYAVRSGPLGPVYVAFNDRGVSAVDLAADDASFERRFQERFGRPAVAAVDMPVSLASRLDRAIAEGRPGDLPLDLSCVTPFQSRVLLKTAEIPRGETRPYGWIAREIRHPSAARAVGSALARNPIPLIVPCHRVVRSDGALGAYSLGAADNKRVLLASEGLDVEGLEELAARGTRLVGSDTTSIFCNPTCGAARRISARHRIEFRSEQAARRRGFRPCKLCRPAAAA